MPAIAYAGRIIYEAMTDISALRHLAPDADFRATIEMILRSASATCV